MTTTTSTAPSADSIRTLFGSSGRRRLTCSRCKDFSTTNQATYSAHLRDCAGASNAVGGSNSSSATALPLLTNPTTLGAGEYDLPVQSQQRPQLWSPALSSTDGDSFRTAAANAVNLAVNPPGAHGGSASWIVDPLSWQLVYQSAAKQLPIIAASAANPTPHSLLTLASAAMAADTSLFPKTVVSSSPAGIAVSGSQSSTIVSAAAANQSTTAAGNGSSQPAIISLMSEESGERYGFREVFKHMYQTNVNGTMMYCCRLCPYQHAVRSRVTKHIRLQHFSKQALNMFTCELCSFTTQHATELEHHRRRHAVNTKVYKCTECEYSTPMQNNFKRHLRRHTSADAFVCSFCSFSSPHEATVKRHAFLYHRKSADGTQTTGSTPGAANTDVSKVFPEACNEEDEFVAEIEDDEDDNNSHASLQAKPTKSRTSKRNGGVSDEQQMDVDNNDKASESGSSSYGGGGSSGGVFVCDICSVGFQSLGSFSQHRAEHERVGLQAISSLPIDRPDDISAATSVPVSGGLMPLDLRCSTVVLPNVSCDSATEASGGILNLSTKPVPPKVASPVMSLSASSKGNARKSVVGSKRHHSPTNEPSPVVASKYPKMEAQQPEDVQSDQAVSQNSQELVERRYGCPICSFEADDKTVVRQHVVEIHPSATSTSSRNRTAGGAAGRNGAAGRSSASSAMLPIRCLSVRNGAASSTAAKMVTKSTASVTVPLHIKCDTESLAKQSPPAHLSPTSPSTVTFNKNRPSSSNAPLQVNDKQNHQQTQPQPFGDSSGAGFQCNVCHYRTYARANFEKHVAYHEDLKIFKCSACGYRCNWKWDMNKHCRAVHNIHSSQSDAAVAAPAHIIVLSLEEARSTLAEYLQRYSSTAAGSALSAVSTLPYLKLFRCSICPFSSRRRKMVERHQRQSHGFPNSCSVLEIASDGLESDLAASDMSVAGGLPTPPASHGTPSTTTSTSTGSHSSPPLSSLVGGINSEAGLIVPAPARVFKCSVCGLRSMWKKSIKSHLSSQHPGTTDGRILVVYVSQQAQRSETTLQCKASQGINSMSSTPSPTITCRAKSNCRRFKCPSCFYRANFFHDVKKHIRNMHQTDAEVVILDEDYAKRTLAGYVIRHTSARRAIGGRSDVNATDAKNMAVDEPLSGDSLSNTVKNTDVTNESTCSNTFNSQKCFLSSYCHRTPSVFNCRKCSFHTSRRTLFLAHCRRHFAATALNSTSHSTAEICHQCGFTSSTTPLVEQHSLLWHGSSSALSPVVGTGSELNDLKLDNQNNRVDTVSAIGFKCTVCNQEMPEADEAAMRDHSSLHVPPALLALGAVRLDALFVALA